MNVQQCKGGNVTTPNPIESDPAGGGGSQFRPHRDRQPELADFTPESRSTTGGLRATALSTILLLPPAFAYIAMGNIAWPTHSGRPYELLEWSVYGYSLVCVVVMARPGRRLGASLMALLASGLAADTMTGLPENPLVVRVLEFLQDHGMDDVVQSVFYPDPLVVGLYACAWAIGRRRGWRWTVGLVPVAGLVIMSFAAWPRPLISVPGVGFQELFLYVGMFIVYGLIFWAFERLFTPRRA